MASFRGLVKKWNKEIKKSLEGLKLLALEGVSKMKVILPAIKMALYASLLSAVALEAPALYDSLLLWKAGSKVLKITSKDSIESGGTGFFIETNEGVKILTNAHICRHLEKMGLGFQEGDYEPSLLYVERISERFDLCMMSGIKKKAGLKLAKEIEVNQRVTVLGHPLLSPLTATKGYVIHNVVTAIPDTRGPKDCRGSGDDYVDFLIQQVCVHYENSWLLSAQIYPGNSGSPVVNTWGEVVGIVFAADTESHRARIVGTEEIQQFLKEMNLQAI